MAIFKRKHYKFTDKKISKRGVASTVLLLIAMAFIGYGLYVSFQAHGDGGTMVGVMGAGGFLASLCGLVLGLASLKDQGVFHSFSWIGSVGNAVICFFMLSLIMIGV